MNIKIVEHSCCSWCLGFFILSYPCVSYWINYFL